MFSRLEIRNIVNSKIILYLLHTKSADDIDAVLIESWRMHLVNIVALTSNPRGEITAYTFYPYVAGHCDEPISVEIAHISNATSLKQQAFDHDLWFPAKLASMNECPMYVATVLRPPYMLVAETPDPIFIDGHRFDDGRSLLHEGLEGRLLHELSRRMGFTVMLNLADGRGVELRNGSMDGMMGRVWILYCLLEQPVIISDQVMSVVFLNQQIADGVVNLSIGMMGQSVFNNRKFRTSISYYEEAVLYALPPGRDYTALEKLLLPFRASLWLACGFSFVVATLMLWTLGWIPRCTKSTAPILEMFSVFAGGGYSETGRRVRGPDQYWLLLWLFVTLVLRTIYQGYMFMIMQTNAQVMPPNTLADLLAEGYFFLMDNESIFFFSSFAVLQNRLAFMVFQKNSNIKMCEFLCSFRAVRSLEPIRSLEMLLHPNASTRGGSVIFGKGAILLFNALQRREHGPHAQQVGISRDNLFTSHSVIIMQNDTIFQEAIDTWLMRMSSSGFVEYAEERMMGPTGSLNKHGDDGAVGVQRLSVEHLWGSFQLWMAGLMVGSVIFTLEIFPIVMRLIK